MDTGTCHRSDELRNVREVIVLQLPKTLRVHKTIKVLTVTPCLFLQRKTKRHIVHHCYRTPTYTRIGQGVFPYTRAMERVRGVEPLSLAWKAKVISDIRYPQTTWAGHFRATLQVVSSFLLAISLNGSEPFPGGPKYCSGRTTSSRLSYRVSLCLNLPQKVERVTLQVSRGIVFTTEYLQMLTSLRGVNGGRGRNRTCGLQSMGLVSYLFSTLQYGASGGNRTHTERTRPLQRVLSPSRLPLRHRS